MYWDVKYVKPLSDYQIDGVEIEDGRKGISGMKPYLDKKTPSVLRDFHYFNQVRFIWCSNLAKRADIAPETLIAGNDSCSHEPPA